MNQPGIGDHLAGNVVDTADPTPTPEPVMDAAKLGGMTAAAVSAVSGLVMLIIAGKAGDVGALGLSVGAAVTAVTTLVSYVAPVFHAKKARAQVTPLAHPRDSTGAPLVRAV